MKCHLFPLCGYGLHVEIRQRHGIDIHIIYDIIAFCVPPESSGDVPVDMKGALDAIDQVVNACIEIHDVLMTNLRNAKIKLQEVPSISHVGAAEAFMLVKKCESVWSQQHKALKTAHNRACTLVTDICIQRIVAAGHKEYTEFTEFTEFLSKHSGIWDSRKDNNLYVSGLKVRFLMRYPESNGGWTVTAANRHANRHVGPQRRRRYKAGESGGDDSDEYAQYENVLEAMEEAGKSCCQAYHTPTQMLCKAKNQLQARTSPRPLGSAEAVSLVKKTCQCWPNSPLPALQKAAKLISAYCIQQLVASLTNPQDPHEFIAKAKDVYTAAMDTDTWKETYIHSHRLARGHHQYHHVLAAYNMLKETVHFFDDFDVAMQRLNWSRDFDQIVCLIDSHTDPLTSLACTHLQYFNNTTFNRLNRSQQAQQPPQGGSHG